MYAPTFSFPGQPPPGRYYWPSYSSQVPLPFQGSSPHLGPGQSYHLAPFDSRASGPYVGYWYMPGNTQQAYMNPYHSVNTPPHPSYSTSHSIHNCVRNEIPEERRANDNMPSLNRHQSRRGRRTPERYSTSISSAFNGDRTRPENGTEVSHDNEPSALPRQRRGILSPSATDSSVSGYTSDPEVNNWDTTSISVQTSPVTFPTGGIPYCELCHRYGHIGVNCRLAVWEENVAELEAAPSAAGSTAAQPSTFDVVKLSEDQEKYQGLAAKLTHICWNLIPDSEQPPESHKTMMKHLLRILSQHPENPETVYDYMFGETFQDKWLCLKAICDTEWQGLVSLADGNCRYCKGRRHPDPVTLCYQIRPSRGRMAMYREVGIVCAQEESCWN
ncbi:hypothetical protein B0H66DRAFT_586883 [Apodospora peruviana]|uniref:Uncharacterized protein n=1 Tax=Apodospora peruviana TaxID=516989 RepID=A0AAE0MG71_9PEZI|nr:hypothetical protein B0H66DRAFT_586883 [Apodospora peruviana]